MWSPTDREFVCQQWTINGRCCSSLNTQWTQTRGHSLYNVSIHQPIGYAYDTFTFGVDLAEPGQNKLHLSSHTVRCVRYCLVFSDICLYMTFIYYVSKRCKQTVQGRLRIRHWWKTSAPISGVPHALKFLNFLKFHLCPEFVLKY